MSKRVNNLADLNGGWWSEHPTFTVKDWLTAAGAAETRLGYWAWVLTQLELTESTDVG